jgi:hypothetical protein
MRDAMLVAMMALSAGAALGDTWQLTFDGSAMPEQEPGWHRVYREGGDVRTITTDPDDPNNHFLVIDGRGNYMATDHASHFGPVDPDGPGEIFVAQWRVLLSVVTTIGPDAGTDFVSNDGHDLALAIGYDYVESVYDQWTYPIAGGVFHTYRVESTDMTYYDLFIDGEFARHAAFFPGLGTPMIDFGDIGYGAARSVAEWDYLRAGVYLTPEPACLILVASVCVCMCRRRP